MNKITPRLTPITPFEVYMQQVNSVYEGIRQKRQGLTYTPAQFGGIFGQQVAANIGTVLELTEFEVK